MEIGKKTAPSRLLWVDLEMTGLDPERHRITEIAAAVTDVNFQTLATYEAIVSQSEEVLADANEWTKEQDTRSGLFEEVRTKGRPEADVQRELALFITDNFSGEPAVLAGNSIHQDRRFIRQWWPEVDALLHYRMLDVSSWKIIMQAKYGVEFEKQEAHRALGDIRESIAELEFYLHWFKDHSNLT